MQGRPFPIGFTIRNTDLSFSRIADNFLGLEFHGRLIQGGKTHTGQPGCRSRDTAHPGLALEPTTLYRQERVGGLFNAERMSESDRSNERDPPLGANDSETEPLKARTILRSICNTQVLLNTIQGFLDRQ